MTLNIFVILLIGGGNNLEMFLFFFVGSIVLLLHWCIRATTLKLCFPFVLILLMFGDLMRNFFGMVLLMHGGNNL